MTEREKLNKITEAIIGAAIQVHRTLGPGLLESAYVACLAYELKRRDSSSKSSDPCLSSMKGSSLSVVAKTGAGCEYFV